MRWLVPLLVLCPVVLQAADAVPDVPAAPAAPPVNLTMKVMPSQISLTYQRGDNMGRGLGRKVHSWIMINGQISFTGAKVIDGVPRLVSLTTDAGETITPPPVVANPNQMDRYENRLQVGDGIGRQGWFNAKLPGPRKPFRKLTELQVAFTLTVAGTIQTITLKPIGDYLDKYQDLPSGDKLLLSRPDAKSLKVSGTSGNGSLSFEQVVSQLVVHSENGSVINDRGSESSMGTNWYNKYYLNSELTDRGSVVLKVAVGKSQVERTWELHDFDLAPDPDGNDQPEAQPQMPMQAVFPTDLVPAAPSANPAPQLPAETKLVL